MRLQRAIAAAAVLTVALAAAGSAQPRAQLSLGPLAITSANGTVWSLVRLKPSNLRPLAGERLDLGLTASSWAFSPHHEAVALGLEGAGADPRASVRVVDVATLAPRAEIPLGSGYVLGLGWLAPARLVAIVERPQTTRLVIADPLAGRVLATTALDAEWLRAYQAAGRLFVLSRESTGGLRLTIVDASGLSPSLPVDNLGHGLPGLAVTPDAQHAYVVGSGGEVAAVDCLSLSVSYHGPFGDATSSESNAVVLPTGQLAIAGARAAHYVDASQDQIRYIGTGLVLVDPTTWSALRVDYRTYRVTVVGQKILATGDIWGGGSFTVTIGGYNPPPPAGDGLSAYTLAGEPLFRRFGGKDAVVDQTYGRRLFVSADGLGSKLAVVDARSGRIIGTRGDQTLPWILHGVSSLNTFG
jgi:hypothetical protein